MVHVLCGLLPPLLSLCCLFVAPQVFSLMNLAYAKHEIISDYITAGLMWFETG